MHHTLFMTILADLQDVIDFFADLGNNLLKILSTIFSFLFLAIDGIVYSALAYSYKLFELMARMNFSALLSWLEPVMDRVHALVLVVVMFVLGYSLIQYLINPDKVKDQKVGSTALIKNIAIAAVLLTIYRDVFTLVGDATFLLIGAPDGYSYNSFLENTFNIENDGSPGLINNLIFGGSSSSEEQVDFGAWLSVKTLDIFLHDRTSVGTPLDDAYRNVIEGKDLNLLPITEAASSINLFKPSEGTVEYKFPIISTLVGLYLVYTIITIAIEIGIRAFKLVILEILAPIAIITIIYGGTSAKIWKNWLSVFGKTFADVFIRVGVMYFMVAFINTAWRRIGELFNYDQFSTSGFTSFLLTILIVVAGFKFAKELPKFIDNILGSKLAENNKSGFTNFLGGLAGGLAGVATGIGAAKAAGLSAPLGAWNALKGGVSGVAAGSKGQKISDNINNIRKNRDSLRSGAETMKTRGGTLRSNAAFGLREITGANYAGQKRTEAAIKSENAKYEGLQWQHNQRVEAENRRHSDAVQAHQNNIDGYNDYISKQSKLMSSKASAHKDDSGQKIMFDSNYVQNRVKYDKERMNLENEVNIAQQQLNASIQRGETGDELKYYMDGLAEAKEKLAVRTSAVTQDATLEYEQNKTMFGITRAENNLKTEQEQLRVENNTHINNTNAENDNFNTITEAHETTVKGAVNANGKRSGGLESQLKHYGGKKQ